MPFPTLLLLLESSQTNFFRSMDYKFVGDTSMWKNTSDVNMNMIEFVTSPNNPDGQLKKAVLRGSSVKTIHDYAYYWPHFTAIPAPADEDLMLFTLSKLTGHAGSRFGWALIKDEEVYERMLKYTDQISFGVSHDTQLIALQQLKAIFQGNNGSDIFEFGFTTMRKRWEILSKALSESNRFSIQKIEPQFCTFYQQLRGPSPAYAWLKCERDEEEDCYEVLRENGIISRRGSVYGAERRYVRLSLIKTQDDFDLLMLRFNSLLSQENYYGIETIIFNHRPLARTRHWETMWKVAEQMKSHNLPISPDLISFIIEHYGKHGLVDQAVELFNKSKTFSCPQNTQIYNSLLFALCEVKNFQGAYALIRRMIRKGVVPDKKTYSILVNWWCSAGKMKEAQEFLSEMSRKGFNPPVRGRDLLVDGLLNAGYLEAAKEMVRKMTKEGFVPDIETFNSLSEALY
ncbi:unnamed protein product [Camellia sinensis]